MVLYAYYAILFLLIVIQSADLTLAATEDSAVRALVYTDIKPDYFDKCIRLMNGTKQIGCQSNLTGNVGVLFHINQSSDVQRVISGPHHPYIAVIYADVFGRDMVEILQSSGKVNGIVVYAFKNYTGKLSGWSPAPQCPRYLYGLYNQSHGAQYASCSKPWNPVGDGLSDVDVDFPVFFMKNDTASMLILQCHDQHNIDGDYPLCAAQMSARMNGAVSTETCIRRNNLQNNLSPAGYCDVMGGFTILGTLQVTNTSNATSKPIILVTAALDSRSFALESKVPGANLATGFISLLAVAQALGSLPAEDKNAMPYNVMFVLYDGETFDNIGSSRMVYDMSKDEFPFEGVKGTWQPARFNLSQVSHVIEIGQLGLVNDTAWMHFDPISAQDPSIVIGKITDALQNSSNSFVSFKNQSTDLGLVPSSLQSILKQRNISGVVITDYNDIYANKYYLSSYDTPDKLGIAYDGGLPEQEALPAFLPFSQKIANISSVIAKAVYNLASGKTLADPYISTERIVSMSYCYYFNGTCSLFKSLIDSDTTVKKEAFNGTVKRYVSAYRENGLKYYTLMAENLLVQYLGDQMIINETQKCKSPSASDKVYTYLSFSENGTKRCYRATVYKIDGRSPSTVIPNYDYANGPYSAWSESRWQNNNFKMSVFLVQDSVSQGMVLLSGLLMLFSSLAIVHIVTKKSDILFNARDVL